MSAIQVLPTHVIDQIAAGEVIERPASVVKELVDNAIDAGATSIVVEATAGGRTLIRVCDDGRGMAPDEVALALARHATSKLRAVDDLWELQTMGFRGEALPSIASVSTLTLTTRRAGDLAATRIVVRAGRAEPPVEVGAGVGTIVEVADLLGNVPARLKFLKGDATEASHITELVARMAMAYPQLHFKLRHNGKTALDVPPDRDGFGRAKALLGVRIAGRMIMAHGEESGVRVTAYLAAPELAQTTARGVQLLVGKRPVRDRHVLHALAMGYGELIPRGRYPVAVIALDVPAGAVDINVHPQKAEVRFADVAAVAAAVRHVVQAAVAPWRSEHGSPVHMTALASVAPPRLPLDAAPATALAQRHAAQATQGRLELGSSPRAWAAQLRSETSRAGETRAQPMRPIRPAAPAPAPVPQPPSTLAIGTGPVPQLPAPTFFSGLRYLGQLDLTYLVCESDGELVLIDQHAAHERVELTRLLAHRAARDVPIQRLLFPATIEVSAAELALAVELGGALAELGFEAEAFGKTTLAIKAVPGGLRHGEPTQLLRTLLAAASGPPNGPDVGARRDQLVATIACHSVVRAGDRLAPSEAEALLRSLDGADYSTPGPHGRSLLLRMPLADIGRRFGR